MSSRKSVRYGSLLGTGLGAALLLAACGGPSTLTHTELVAKADAACHSANRAAGHLEPPGNSYASLNRYARRLSPIVQRQINDLSGLRAGSSDRQALNNYIKALREGRRGLRVLSTASSTSEVHQGTELITSQPFTRLATTLGAKNCGSAPT